MPTKTPRTTKDPTTAKAEALMASCGMGHDFTESQITPERAARIREAIKTYGKERMLKCSIVTLNDALANIMSYSFSLAKTEQEKAIAVAIIIKVGHLLDDIQVIMDY